VGRVPHTSDPANDSPGGPVLASPERSREKATGAPPLSAKKKSPQGTPRRYAGAARLTTRRGPEALVFRETHAISRSLFLVTEKGRLQFHVPPFKRRLRPHGGKRIARRACDL